MRPETAKRFSLLVSFSGIDGAGKSTQIANLCAHLAAAGLQVKVVTFWDDVAALKGLREGAGHKIFKGDKGVGTPERPINRQDKNVRSPIINAFRSAIYLLDAISLRRVASRAVQSQADVVIFDRYIYDELANLDLEKRLPRRYARWLMKLVPRPDVSFILDADPTQARARKPEYPLQFLHINRASYLALHQVLEGMTVIPPMSIEDAKEKVLQAIPCDRLSRKRLADCVETGG